jgi:hypothetical protein
LGSQKDQVARERRLEQDCPEISGHVPHSTLVGKGKTGIVVFDVSLDEDDDEVWQKRREKGSKMKRERDNTEMGRVLEEENVGGRVMGYDWV